jgi:hypothetical protein
VNRKGGEMLAFAIRIVLTTLLFFLTAADVRSEGEVLEFSCPSCGYREQFVQGFNATDEARNIQRIIVVCERNHQIRSIAIALNESEPVKDEPLLAKQYGMGKSELLGGIKLPRFLVPGNTCPLFPITAYLQRNICPIDGREGLHYKVMGRY